MRKTAYLNCFSWYNLCREWPPWPKKLMLLVTCMLYTSVYCSAPTPIRILVYSRKIYPKTQRSTNNSAKHCKIWHRLNSKSELCKYLQHYPYKKELGMAVYELLKSSSFLQHEKKRKNAEIDLTLLPNHI